MTSKNLFDTTITIEHIQDVPFNRGYLFAKLKLDKFRKQTVTKKIVNHKVDWHETFQLQCSIKSNNGRLIDKHLRVQIKKEANGGESFEKLGYFDINLAERASFTTPAQGRYLLKVNKKSKTMAGNAIVVVTTSMVRLMGDPIFKAPPDTQVTTLEGPNKDLDQGNNVNIRVPSSDASSGDEDAQSVTSQSNSPALSMDCVRVGTQSPPEEDPCYTTQSLDRRQRSKPRTIIKSLRTKSYSGSISSMVDGMRTTNGASIAGSESVLKSKHPPQSRQDSGLGGSAEEHIAN